MLRVALLLLVVGVPALAEGATLVAADRDAAPDGYRFEPARVEAAPGEVVTVVARGAEPHTVTPVERGAFADARVNASETRTFTAPATPGEYPFYCKFHAGPQASPDEAMAGVLVVRAQATPTAGPTPAASATPAATPAKDAPGAGLAPLIVALALVALAARR